MNPPAKRTARGERKERVYTGRDYRANDGKHYWNCWTSNYIPKEDGYIIHVFCEEDRTGRSLCGVRCWDGGGLSVPLETAPGCLRCTRIMQKRGVIPLEIANRANLEGNE